MVELRNFYTYPDFSDEEFLPIFEAHKRITLKKNTILLKAGAIANEYYCIDQGTARAFVEDRSGNQITTEFAVDGNFLIDPVSFFQRIGTFENLQTISECEAWVINVEDFLHLFHNHQKFREWVGYWMTNVYFRLKTKMISIINSSATERYLSLMMHQPKVINQVPLKFISSYLGITDTSLSRIRSEISKPA